MLIGTRMVHHTRNTIDKQWNESLVIVISGIVRVFKIFYLALNELSNYSEVWRKLFEEMTKASLFSSAEVSSVRPSLNSPVIREKNAVQAMLDLFISQASVDNFDRNLWEISWSSIEELSGTVRERVSIVKICFDCQGNSVPLSTVTNFANQMSNLYNKLQAQFTFHDRIRYVVLLCHDTTDILKFSRLSSFILANRRLISHSLKKRSFLY